MQYIKNTDLEFISLSDDRLILELKRSRKTGLKNGYQLYYNLVSVDCIPLADIPHRWLIWARKRQNWLILNGFQLALNIWLFKEMC